MYNTIYDIVTGPLAWFGWAVFILGSLYRLTSLYSQAKKKDASSIAYVKASYGIKSILHWITPFGALGWREYPVMTVATFVFHICLLGVPLFLGAHVDLWNLWFGISLPALPDTVADTMTSLVLVAAAYFAYRRFTVRTVAFVTTWKDWMTLIIAVAPFLTGFMAYHQILDYQFMIVLHVVTGVAWLVFIPFGRLSHAILGWYSRVYIASEFQGVRRCKDW